MAPRKSKPNPPAPSTQTETLVARFQPAHALASSPHRIRQLLVVMGALVFSCMPQSQVVAPQVEPTSTLHMGPEETADPAPFSLVHAAPKGPTSADPAVHLVFSHPLRALDAEAPPPGGIRLEPMVPGKWQWVGVYGLTFVPESGSLPRATRFTVSVPAGLKDADGHALDESEQFEFSTPVVNVTRAAPNQTWSDRRPHDRVVLSFSQPVDPEHVRPYLHFWTQAGDVDDLRVEAGRSREQLVVSSTAGWPLDSLVEYEVRPGYRSLEGPLPATASFRGKFRTYGPLTATIECDVNPTGACRPEGGLRLRLSNPVRATQLTAAVSATGTQLRVDRDWSKGATTRYLNLAHELTPRAQFTVNVGALTDVYGQRLQWVKNRQIRVGDLRPSVRLGFSGDSIPVAEKGLSIVSVNASYELSWAPLDQRALSEFSELRGEERARYFEQLEKRQLRKIPVGNLNQHTEYRLPLEEVVDRGAFAIGVHYQSEGEPWQEIRWAQRTNLGLTVKQGRDASMVWVTDLLSGAPVPQAEIHLPGERISSVMTDVRGIAHLPKGRFVAHPDKSRPGEWLEVRKGSDRVVRSSRDAMGGWSLPVSTDFYGEAEDQAELFLERDLFRPGETGAVKGYLRRPAKSGNLPLVQEKVELVLRGPDDSEVSRAGLVTNEFGALSHRVTIPAESPLGYFTLTLERGERRLASTHIQVAEFRPAEFEVDAQSETPAVIAGEPVEWHVTGSYFYGGVMNGSEVGTTVARRPTTFAPPGTDDFVTDDEAWQVYEPYQYHDPLLGSRDGTLDEYGKWSGSTDSQLKDQVGAERLELEATVHDLSGQAQSTRASVLVHPAAHYVALQRPETTLLDAPTSLTPLLKTVRPEGTQLAGQVVRLELYRLRWVSARQSQGHASSYQRHELVRDLMDSCSVTSAMALRGCALSVSEAGHYLVRAASRDARGRTTYASAGYYALGNGASGFRDDGDRGQVELTLDRKQYLPGQIARILVQSPFQSARAWVTVEREGVHSEKLVRLTGPTPTITVPIDESMRPGAFVSVHLVEDRAALGARAHQLSESYRLGYAELRIDPERQRLGVEVSSNESAYRPGDEVTLDVTVRDQSGRGRQAEVTLFVVDEGVLTLSGYEMPDPLKAFTRPRPLRVETIEGRQSLARLFGLEALKRDQKGAPGGGGGEERSEFMTAAYFNPSLVTNGAGRGTARFTLPDNVGRFRIMALAVTEDDRYGRGKGSFEVNRPLMVRPALPRFVRAGDALELATVVSALGFSGGPVTVDVQAEGLRVDGPTKKTVELAPGQSKFVAFPARADHPGSARVRFSVSTTGVVRDQVLLERRVQSPAILETVALYGKTTDAVAHGIGSLGASRPDMGGLDVTLSSSALVGLEGSFEQLWGYPYACSEQLASRILPLVILDDLAALYGIERPKDAERRVAEAVASLVRRQRGDGGFGMWPESRDSHPWVSSYVLWALWEARARGQSVSDTVFERGTRFLRDLAAQRTKSSSQGDDSALAEAAFAAFALARIGHPDPSTVLALTDLVQQMDPEEVALLLLASTASKVEDATDLLAKRLEGSVTVRGNRAEVAPPHGRHARRFWPSTMGSPTRLTAMTLLGLLQARSDHPMAAPLVRGLLDERRQGAWGSTQESAFALLALDTYRKAQEAEEPEFDAYVFLGERLLGKKHFVGRSTQAQGFFVSREKLSTSGNLAFRQEGRGTLFYEARLQTARLTLPTAPLERGFVVTRRLRPVAGLEVATPGGELVGDRIGHGNLALVELTVLSPTKRRYVVIDDPLPAGFEAVDLSQDTAQGTLRELLTRQPGTSFAWHRTELRDDRVLQFVDDMPPGVYEYKYLARATTRGEFVVPPTVVKEMYQEEIYGRTAANTVEVR